MNSTCEDTVTPQNISQDNVDKFVTSLRELAQLPLPTLRGAIYRALVDLQNNGGVDVNQLNLFAQTTESHVAETPASE